MIEIKNLSKNELLRLLRAYDKYIKEYFDDEAHEGMIPICLEEFYNNEYGMYLEVGDIVYFGNFVEDEDLNEWLDNRYENGNFTEFTINQIEDDKFYIDDCPYGIMLSEDWKRTIEIDTTDEVDETNYYLRNKFNQVFISDRVIDDIMDLCNQKKLNDYMIKHFRENVDLEEYREIFDDLDDEQFENILEDLGFYYSIEDYNKLCSKE